MSRLGVRLCLGASSESTFESFLQSGEKFSPSKGPGNSAREREMAFGILVRVDENPCTVEAENSMDAHPMAVQEVAKDMLLRWRQALLVLFRFECSMVC